MALHDTFRRLRLYPLIVSLALFLNGCVLAIVSLHYMAPSWLGLRDQTKYCEQLLFIFSPSRNGIDFDLHSTAYIGNDFPRMLPVDLPDILVTTDEFVEYELYGEQAIADWGAQVPKGNGVVRLGDYRREFVVVAGHELHCLARLVWAINDPADPMSAFEHSGHCLDYLRQRILCDADLTLEPFDPLELDPAKEKNGAMPVHKCKDYTKMLGALHDNLEEWERSEFNVKNHH